LLAAPKAIKRTQKRVSGVFNLGGSPPTWGRYQGIGSRLVHEGVPQENFMALAFGGPIPKGSVEFHPAFWATE
jgi:hypothetical protein